MVGAKLKEYLTNNGVRYSWFAKYLGVSQVQLAQIFLGKQKLAPRYWVQVIVYTEGYITLADLIKEKLREIPNLTVTEGKTNTSCSLSLNIVNRE